MQQLANDTWRQARAGVLHRNFHRFLVQTGGNHNGMGALTAVDGVDRVAHQIENDLLDLERVGQYQWQIGSYFMADADLVAGSRIIMEKPFGTDLASAVALNARLHEVFDEQQIFRIDHFLGKEPAQNILAFRFANGLFEPIWNRNFIDHVQIDVPETLGLGRRSAFYEQTGAYRDMVVTHLFQICLLYTSDAADE